MYVWPFGYHTVDCEDSLASKFPELRDHICTTCGPKVNCVRQVDFWWKCRTPPCNQHILGRPPVSDALPDTRERELFIDNLFVRLHLIIEMTLVDRPCAMGVWIPFSGSLTSTLLPSSYYMRSYTSSTVERIKHMYDSQGQTRAMALREKSLQPFKRFPLRSPATSMRIDSPQHVMIRRRIWSHHLWLEKGEL
jgi:hypothetical protein